MKQRSHGNRPERVGSVIQKRLAEIIQFELHEPRIKDFITVSEVKLSADLSHAKVYIARIGGTPEDIEAFLTPFRELVPFFRKRIAKEVKLRIVPDLHFVYDTSLEYSDRLTKLIDQSLEEDESNQSDDS